MTKHGLEVCYDKDNKGIESDEKLAFVALCVIHIYYNQWNKAKNNSNLHYNNVLSSIYYNKHRPKSRVSDPHSPLWGTELTENAWLAKMTIKGLQICYTPSKGTLEGPRASWVFRFVFGNLLKGGLLQNKLCLKL